MRHRGVGRAGALALVVTLVGCAEKKPQPQPAASAAAVTRASSAPAPAVSAVEPGKVGLPGLLLVTYMPSPPTRAEVDAAKARARAAAADVAIVDDPDHVEPRMVHFFAASGADLEPISQSTLKYFAHGLDDAAKAAATGARGALGAGWILDGDAGHQRMKAALGVARATAQALHGLVWDDTIRILYTPTAFDTERVASWQGAIPDMRRHIAQHYYEDGGRHRAVTLGMQSFGVPDLVVQDVPVPLSSGVGDLVNVVAQLLVEGAHPSAAGDLEVDVSRLQHEAVRKAFTSPKSAPIVVRLTPAKPEEGDAENALLAIEFPAFAAPTEAERQGLALKKLFGAEEKLLGAPEGDAELAAIQQRVQQKLPELAKRFRAPRPVGTRFSVKVPFETDDKSTEWMWVEIVDWPSDAELKGNLKNEPFSIKSLHLGALVVVKASSIADYVWTSPDGKEEGGESSDVLSRRK